MNIFLPLSLVFVNMYRRVPLTVYPMGVATLVGSALRCWQLTWKKVKSRWCASVRFAGSFILISS